MSKLFALVMVATLALIVSADRALSQMVCGLREHIVADLEKKYGETRHSMGFQRGRGVVEIFASVETGSWTILLSRPDGVSCLMAAGEAFQQDEIAVDDAET